VQGRGLNVDRRPASLEEARSLVAYNERILHTSESAQRRDRAERMLANVRPYVAEFEAKAPAAAPTPPARTDDAFDVVWDGNAGSLTPDAEGLGSSLGREFEFHGGRRSG
jgi:hypothetical protein